MRNQITDKFPMYKKIVWGFPSLVASGFWGIMSGYVTYYLTQSVLLSSAAVGMVLMATKIFDGFTDLFAGYFIDKTTTKWGKGRPYSLFASVGWIFIILLFSVPSFFSTTGKLVYVFICSVMIESVSFTLFKCSEHVYMLRAIPNEKDKSSSIAIASVIITYLSTVLAIVMPIAVKSIGSSSRGWTLLALIIGVPAMVLGTFRFVFIKEIVEPAVSASAKESKTTVKRILTQLVHNKYGLIVVGIIMAYYFGQTINSTVMTYYFTYNIGDLAMLSYISATALITPLVLLLIPRMLEKMGKRKVILIGMCINLAACIIRAFAPTNLVLYAITSVVGSMSTLPMVYFNGLLLMDCMDYGEWKTGYRVESGYSAVSNAGHKLAAGLASGFVGLIMGVLGFVSGADTQSASALAGIKGLTIYAPIAIAVLLVVLTSLYKLDDLLPQIRKELTER